MGLQSKTFSIRDITRVDNGNSEHVYFDYTTGACAIGTTWNFTRDSAAWTGPGNEYGDATITERSIIADGDLIFTAGWGDGFGYRRLNESGSMTLMYYDALPANSYANYNSLAVDKVRKKVYIGNYPQNNFTVYDYSDSSSISKVGQITEAGNGLPSDAAGAAYNNGLEVVGDWLYIGNGDKTSTSLLRWHVVSESADNLAVYAVSAAGRYGRVYYEEARDRIWITWQSNGEIWVVSSASLSSSAATPPTASNLRLNLLGLGNDMYCSVVIPDKDDSNIVTVAGIYMRTAKLNIAGVLSQVSTSPDIIDKNDALYNYGLNNSPLWINGYHATEPHPIHGSDLAILNPNRNFLYNYGWIDQERFVPVGGRYPYGYAFDLPTDLTTKYQYLPDNDIVYGYGTLPILAQASGGTEYWVQGGYGLADSYDFHTFSKADFPNGMELQPSGVLAFGDFYLNDSSSIGSCQIQGVSESSYAPSGTNLYSYVSNDGGSTWELYDYATEEIYNFTSSGNTGKVKFVFSGSVTKTPYFSAAKFFSFTFNSYDPINRDIITTYASLNIQGV